MPAQRRRLRRPAALLALFLLPGFVSPSLAGAQPLPDEPPDAGPERGFRGCLAIRGERVLAAEEPGRLFTPASVLKVVVSAAALHHLGPEFRVETRLRGSGEVAGGTLAGDLVVEAAGDPSWSARFFPEDPAAPLASLARQLASRGVRRVAGDLVVDARRFPGRSAPPGRALSELAYGFAAPTSALAVDENAVDVDVAPGPRPGAPGTARFAPGSAPGALRLVARIDTVASRRHGKGTVDFLPVWGGSTLVVRGEYPESEPPYRVSAAVPWGELHAGERLAEALRRRGIAVDGEVRVATAGAAAVSDGEVLARFRSPPLPELLRPILEESSNWHAEMLLRLLAAEVLGEGRSDDALELERRFLEDVVGLAPDAFYLDDASGLSPTNLVTPEAVVGLLRFVHRQPWRRQFVGALATPGRGTLQGWPPLPPVAAKTGTLEGTVALAGYLDPPAAGASVGVGEPVIFACFLDHRPGASPPLRAEIAGLVRRWAAGRTGT